MDVLLWLVPSAVVTVVAMCWVSWLGRERHQEVDRDVAAERLGRALRKDSRVRYAAPRAERDRSSGLAVRPSRLPGAARGTDDPGRRAS